MHRELERTVDSIVDDSASSLPDRFTADLAERLRADCADLVAQISQLDSQDSSKTVVNLLDCLQRIQRGDSVVKIAGELVESAAKFCGRSGLLINKGDKLLGFRLAGPGAAEKLKAFQALSVDPAQAESLKLAIQSANNIVASGSPQDLSSGLVQLLELAPEDRVALFPVQLRSRVLGVLYCDARGADGKSAPMQSAAIEALISSAEGWIEAASTRKAKSNPQKS